MFTKTKKNKVIIIVSYSVLSIWFLVMAFQASMDSNMFDASFFSAVVVLNSFLINKVFKRDDDEG